METISRSFELNKRLKGGFDKIAKESKEKVVNINIDNNHAFSPNLNIPVKTLRNTNFASRKFKFNESVVLIGFRLWKNQL